MDGMHVEEPFKVIKMLRISIGSTEISTKLFPFTYLPTLECSIFERICSDLKQEQGQI